MEAACQEESDSSPNGSSANVDVASHFGAESLSKASKRAVESTCDSSIEWLGKLALQLIGRDA